MDKFFVYILYSTSIDKYYIGFSQNPDKRVMQHNHPDNTKWSKRGQPWKLMKSIEFDSKTEALKVEKFIKKQKSRKLIEKVIHSGWE